MRSVDDLIAAGGPTGLAGKRVLLRADLNVPLGPADATGAGAPRTVTDDGRIRAVLPTLALLREAGARVVLASHLGRPKGVDPASSLAPVAARLSALLHTTVPLAGDTAGESAAATVAALGDGDVCLLENLRFEPGETSKDEGERAAFAASLAALADLYVDDAFGAVHRAHASVTGVPALLPHAAGRLVLAELAVLEQLAGAAPSPYVVVLGGSKVSDKLGVIRSLLPRVDRLLVGGGMCFTFLAAQGHEVGTSLLEADQVDTCRELLAAAGDRLVLPVDIVAATAFSADAEHAVVSVDAIPADRMGLDIGPRTVELFTSQLADARTVFWNGPMGVFELAPFAEGTRGVADSVGRATRHGATTVVGGGDSAAAVRTLGLDEGSYSHISTGGGASLEFLEGRVLPGLAALEA